MAKKEYYLNIPKSGNGNLSVGQIACNKPVGTTGNRFSDVRVKLSPQQARI